MSVSDFPVLQIILLNDRKPYDKNLVLLKQEFPHLHFVSLPTGHYPMWEKPNELAETVNSFVNEN